jgi:GntR family transcriptional regulator/MocR family aminotransferase
MPRTRSPLQVAGWRPDPGSPKPLYRQVYERFRDAIRNAVLRPGERLPSARSLASQLGAARGTVDLAYNLLSSEGYIVGRGAAGTFVAQGLTAAQRRAPSRSPDASSTGVIARPGAPPLVIPPFAMGVPALDAFPRALWGRLSARRARTVAVETMIGDGAAGYAPLRDAIVSYLTVSRAIRCHAGQVFITTGFQGALDLLTRTFLQPGDEVCFEDPGYFHAREALRTAGARIIPTPVDSEGLDVAEAINRAPHARFVCVTPAHQAPLGISLTLPRRLALLSWAARSKAWIIEDDYDSEYRYGSRPLPALKSLDEAGRVLYVGTFSKVLFPGLRLGYLVVPDSEVERIKQVRQLLYRGAPILMQTVVADFMTEGHFARHIKRMRALYEERRAALADALAEAFEGQLTVQLQAGGMHLIGRMPALKDDRDRVARAKAHGLAPMTLSEWYAKPGRGDHGIVLGFTNIAPENALEGAMRLKRALSSP